eukprot:gnl/Hemi2/19040_TR6305_c0_g1_i1.p1 gnl/Hemi2/19040_TR6305_c0_g1~~gnl/Hemi2/19040_TR6305_c0_g1_i1.p1  ORF type:complete len:148 (-),score=13.78 gnl/Hemi2/19040_TR6305_c0_g1_i1:181-624(-)
MSRGSLRERLPSLERGRPGSAPLAPAMNERPASAEQRHMERDMNLFKACLEGRLSDLMVLVDAGGDINCAVSKNQYGCPLSPLHIACSAGHADIVAYLLEQGADASGGGDVVFQHTPLELAQENGHKNVVLLLREHFNVMRRSLHIR